ncbi:molybdate ABC transporter permease subunit [Chitinimonas arctica]|uniref:Molybdenum transport system permease n=1 Tax=Chitinimonas arctica TaxID=2594795 RepID=A0A516SH52_9NEIS|nr:molybdate ABC transporter permease subunit [Chitinimonas arctica]QDQ27440.1 molybdate ABC transporter permease subunit [Chitinimonas arctica]
MLLNPTALQALWLTLKLAAMATLLLVVIGLPLAGWLAESRSRFAAVLEALVGLPIVLPPTVIGFYLLIALAPGSPLGAGWIMLFGQPLAFSFAGLVAGSLLYSLPFAVQPFTAALKSVPANLREAAAALGASRRQRFWRVLVPAAMPGLLAGATLAFAHTLGEFGVVLMLGGNLAGETRVASIALYDEVQALNYPAAHALAATLLLISFSLLLTIAVLQRRLQRRWEGQA